jgi:hypothetical protein
MNYPNTTDLSQVIRASPFWQDNGDGALNMNDSVFPVEGDAETDEWVGERTEQQQKSQDVEINKTLMKPVRVLDELFVVCESVMFNADSCYCCCYK